MGSHRDDDATIPKGFLGDIAEHMESVRKRAERMTFERANEITAGREGEEILSEKVSADFTIRQMPDDPDGVLRISIGEMPGMPNTAYLVFRGHPRAIEQLLERALARLQRPFGG